MDLELVRAKIKVLEAENAEAQTRLEGLIKKHNAECARCEEKLSKWEAAAFRHRQLISQHTDRISTAVHERSEEIAALRAEL